MVADFSYISDLTDDTMHWKVRLRISRIWLASIPGRSRDEADLECIGIDEQGDNIHIVIDNSQIQIYQPLLTEGNIYIISYFNVIQVTNYEPTQRNIKIEFVVGTTLLEDLQFNGHIQKDIFNLWDFANLHERHDNISNTIDLLGLLISVSDKAVTPTKFGDADRTDIVLKDLDNREQSVTLWGQVSDNFHQLNLLQASGAKILIITSLIVRHHRAIYKATSTSATKIYVNFDCPLVSDYLTRFDDVGNEPKLVAPENYTKRNPNLRLLPPAEMKTIRELLDLPRSNLRDRKFECEGVIKKFELERFWFYLGCRLCYRTMKTVAGELKCTGCGATKEHAGNCYKLEAIVSDGTAEALFIFFETASEQLVGLPLSVVQNNDPTTRRTLPSAISNLKNTCWKFEVVVNSKTFAKPTLQFTVNKVLGRLANTLALPAPESDSIGASNSKGKRPMDEVKDENDQEPNDTFNEQPRNPAKRRLLVQQNGEEEASLDIEESPVPIHTQDPRNYSLIQGESGHATSQDDFGHAVETFGHGQNNSRASQGLKTVKIEKEDRPTKIVYKAKCKNQQVGGTNL